MNRLRLIESHRYEDPQPSVGRFFGLLGLLGITSVLVLVGAFRVVEVVAGWLR